MKLNLVATGYWKINNKGDKYTGDLYLNEEKGGIALYIRIPNTGPTMSYLELPLEIPFITGSLTNGANITLAECSRVSTKSIKGFEEIFGYKAEFKFEGIKFNTKENMNFTKMTIDIPNIIQWGDVSNYKKPDLDNTNDSIIDLKIIEPIELYSNKSYKVYYNLTFSEPFNLKKEEITLKQTPQLIIQTQSVQTIIWFINKANQIKRLIEIAVGSPLNYGSMKVESPEIFNEFGDDDNIIRPLDVFHGYKHNEHIDTKLLIKHDYLFSLSELKQANFSQWQEVATIMEPIIELYIDSLYNQNLSVSRHFLNMIQALETYHSRIIAHSLADYKKRVAELVDVRPVALHKQTRDFLLDGCRGHVILRSRLSDLLLADYRFNFNIADFKLLKFPQIIVDTRNYYTHYNQKLENKALKGDDLVVSFHILRNILEFYLLKELGFKEDFIHERIRERIKPIIHSHEIKKTDKGINKF